MIQMDIKQHVQSACLVASYQRLLCQYVNRWLQNGCLTCSHELPCVVAGKMGFGSQFSTPYTHHCPHFFSLHSVTPRSPRKHLHSGVPWTNLESRRSWRRKNNHSFIMFLLNLCMYSSTASIITVGY